MIDIVYPLGKGSHYKDDELRFSLRSVEKYLSGYDKVWIIGERPEWLQNINHIPFDDDITKPPDYNIMRKISRAIEEPELTDDFLFLNDDHFLLHPFTANEFPYFYEKTLEVYLKERGSDTYGRRAKNTLEHLKANNLPTKHFDIHFPIIYNKSLFLQHVTNAVDWNKNAYVIKSMYANSLLIEGVEGKDSKIGKELPSLEKVFSTTPRYRANIQRFFREQYPKASRFEKQ